MVVSVGFMARYAIPLIVASIYLGDVDVPQQFEIFEKTQRLTDLTLSHARKEGDLDENGQVESFDYIIVGGGSAGAIVANRLSASGEHTVLLLEAGGDPNPIMEVPFAQRFYWQKGNPMDWNYTTVKQNKSCGYLNGNCPWPRGKALGGSSSVNGLLYNRCKPKDYDFWANFTGDDSWSWKNIKDTYNSFEDYHGFYEDTNAENHGRGGEMYVGKIDFIPGIEIIEEALREKNIPIGDANGGEEFTHGFSRVDYNIKGGLRWGTYQAFIDPILDRTNLKIYRYAYVTKVDIASEDLEVPKAVGVTYQRHGVSWRALANKEVILAAGVVESPKILMLSGVGPKDHLDDLNITTVVDLPVGKYLQEHPGTNIVGGTLEKLTGFRVNTTFGRNFNTSEAVLELIQNGTGPFNNFAYEENEYAENGYATQVMMGYLSSSLNPDRDWPDLHFYIVAQFEMQNNVSVEQFFASFELLRSNTTGTIKLKSRDPRDAPIIDPNFFEDPLDIEKMIDGIEMIMDIFMNSTTLQRFGIQPLEPFEPCSHLLFQSREYWKCFLEVKAVPFFHPTSTCRMGPNSSVAVVDSELKVFGVENLRVIDASVIPFAPSGNTNLPSMLVGARGAEIILKSQK